MLDFATYFSSEMIVFTSLSLKVFFKIWGLIIRSVEGKTRVRSVCIDDASVSLNLIRSEFNVTT